MFSTTFWIWQSVFGGAVLVSGLLGHSLLSGGIHQKVPTANTPAPLAWV